MVKTVEEGEDKPKDDTEDKGELVSSEKDSFEETDIEDVEKPHLEKFDSTSPMQPLKK